METETKCVNCGCSTPVDAPQTATVSDDRSKYYIVWNENRSEGFATDDYSDALQVLEGEFHNGHTSLGYEFHESYGEGEKHFETVDPAALSAAEPVDQWQDIATCEPVHALFYGTDRHGEKCVMQGYKVINGTIYIDNRDAAPVKITHWMPLPAAPASKGGE